jgi:TetR/AcrR family transcriptional regulator, repressor for neighboring sulfatase
MPGEQERRQRGTREETTATILDAAEKLFVRRGYTAVTIREIAAEAGVSHALVHRYLGSKEDVYRATLRHNETLVRDAAAGEDELLEATRLMLREAVLRQQRYLRLIAHSTLHGLSYEQTSGRFAATERLIELADRVAQDGEYDTGAPSPRFVIVSLVAMLLGWSSSRDWLLRVAGLEDMSEEEFLASFERVMLDIERVYFPTAEAPAGE